jgi:opacity protein-like surface antigen
MKIALALVVLFAAVSLHAQTPSPVPSLGQYQIGAGYSSVTGPTDNGTLLTAAKQFGSRVWGQAKCFMLASPTGVLMTSIGPRFRPPLSAVIKPSGYFNSSKWYPFVDANVGAVKDPTGATKFAYGVGGGLDYQVASNITILVVEADYMRSKLFPTGSILVTNVATVTSGLKFTF